MNQFDRKTFLTLDETYKKNSSIKRRFCDANLKVIELVYEFFFFNWPKSNYHSIFNFIFSFYLIDQLRPITIKKRKRKKQGGTSIN